MPANSGEQDEPTIYGENILWFVLLDGRHGVRREQEEIHRPRAPGVLHALQTREWHGGERKKGKIGLPDIHGLTIHATSRAYASRQARGLLGNQKPV